MQGRALPVPRSVDLLHFCKGVAGSVPQHHPLKVGCAARQSILSPTA